MKTVDFLDFFEFENQSKGRGKKIEDNQCSVLVNKKNNTYYFRFVDLGFEYLRVGKSNGNIYFVLNKKDGIKGNISKYSTAKRSNTIAFSNKTAVLTMLDLLEKSQYDKTYHKCIFEFEIIDYTEENLVLKFVKIK